MSQRVKHNLGTAIVQLSLESYAEVNPVFRPCWL